MLTGMGEITDTLDRDRVLALRRDYGLTVQSLTASADWRAVLTEPDHEDPPELAIRSSTPTLEIADILDRVADLLRQHLHGAKVFEGPREDGERRALYIQ
jgi:hypothetical protein